MNLKPLMIEGRSARKTTCRNDEKEKVCPSVDAPKAVQIRTEQPAIKPNFEIHEWAKTRLVPPPEKSAEMKVVRPSLLTRAISVLRGAAPAPRQLRVAETVALGEKRFVAIIHAEGRKYLVGGGATGVALLTQLDEPAQPLEQHRDLAQMFGVAR